MAPLDRLGDKFALGAWVVDGDTHSGFLAKCTQFDENAVSIVLPLAAVPRAGALRPESAPAWSVAGRTLGPPGWRNG